MPEHPRVEICSAVFIPMVGKGCTRNTAATNLRASGMDEADAMKVLGHKTPSIFRRYNLGDTEALRDRLTRANEWVRSLPSRPPVVPLRSATQPSAATH